MPGYGASYSEEERQRMNTERNAYTGWMTTRDRQLFHVLLDGLPDQYRHEVVDALVRGELRRHPSAGAEDTAHQRECAPS
jgi:hypothetical protein